MELTYEDAENLYHTYSEIMKSPDMLVELSRSRWLSINEVYNQAKKDAAKYKAMMEELQPKA